MTDRPGSRDKPLERLKTGTWSRGWSLAKLTVGTGARVAGKVLSGDQGNRRFWSGQALALARELGKLKGSAMKVGQMLSMHGEHFFPPEVNQALKSLQSQSPPLAWPEIERVLKRQLRPEQLAQLEIDREPWASASLGQVHRARVIAGAHAGAELALKIQYPGVDEAIDSDLKLIRGLFAASKVLPGGSRRYDALFAEIRDMLLQEIDYGRELALTRDYAAALGDDPRFEIPEVFPEFSTRKILASRFAQGIRVDDAQVLSLPLERRNRLGQSMLELYLSEVFGFGLVQTDPHFGNYLVRLGQAGEPDRLVLLDFGAVRRIGPEFQRAYIKMVGGAFAGDAERVSQATDELGFTGEGDSAEIRAAFARLCELMLEPFGDYPEPYRWHGTDLPQRAMRGGLDLAVQFRFRPPPREIVFLDRKLGGVFIWIAALKAEFRARELLQSALNPGTRSPQPS